MIHCDFQDQIAVLRMEHGKVNAMDLEFLQQMELRLDEIIRSDVRAVILTGNGTAFSAGVDLFRLLDGGAGYAEKFLPMLSIVFEKLFSFPKPVVSATNGHAIAGGCIMNCACDYRIMAAGASRIGVPELLVGVPFPPMALEIMRFSTPRQYLREIIYMGGTFHPEDALRKGLIDEIVPSGQLISRATEIARNFAAIPPNSFQIVKQMLRRPALESANAARNHPEISRAWSDPVVHSVIRNYLARTIGKK